MSGMKLCQVSEHDEADLDSDIPFVSDSESDSEINIVSQTPPNPFLLTISNPRLNTSSPTLSSPTHLKLKKTPKRGKPNRVQLKKSSQRCFLRGRKGSSVRKKYRKSIIEAATGHEYEVVSSDVMIRKDTVIPDESASNSISNQSHQDASASAPPIFNDPNEVIRILENEPLHQDQAYQNSTLSSYPTPQEIIHIDPVQILNNDNIEQLTHTYQPSQNLYQAVPSTCNYSPLEQSTQVTALSQDSMSYNPNSSCASNLVQNDNLSFPIEFSPVFCMTGQNPDPVVTYGLYPDNLNHSNIYNNACNYPTSTTQPSTSGINQSVLDNVTVESHLNIESNFSNNQSFAFPQYPENHYESIYSSSTNVESQNVTTQFFTQPNQLDSARLNNFESEVNNNNNSSNSNNNNNTDDLNLLLERANGESRNETQNEFQYHDFAINFTGTVSNIPENLIDDGATNYPSVINENLQTIDTAINYYSNTSDALTFTDEDLGNLNTTNDSQTNLITEQSTSDDLEQLLNDDSFNVLPMSNSLKDSTATPSPTQNKNSASESDSEDYYTDLYRNLNTPICPVNFNNNLQNTAQDDTDENNDNGECTNTALSYNTNPFRI